MTPSEQQKKSAQAWKRAQPKGLFTSAAYLKAKAARR